MNDRDRRDLFAAMALSGLCSNSLYIAVADENYKETSVERERYLAIGAVQMADALIAALDEDELDKEDEPRT